MAIISYCFKSLYMFCRPFGSRLAKKIIFSFFTHPHLHMHLTTTTTTTAMVAVQYCITRVGNRGNWKQAPLENCVSGTRIYQKYSLKYGILFKSDDGVFWNVLDTIFQFWPTNAYFVCTWRPNCWLPLGGLPNGGGRKS